MIGLAKQYVGGHTIGIDGYRGFEFKSRFAWFATTEVSPSKPHECPSAFGILDTGRPVGIVGIVETPKRLQDRSETGPGGCRFRATAEHGQDRRKVPQCAYMRGRCSDRRAKVSHRVVERAESERGDAYTDTQVGVSRMMRETFPEACRSAVK